MKFTFHTGKKAPWILTNSEKFQAKKRWESGKVDKRWHGNLSRYYQCITKEKFYNWISKYRDGNPFNYISKEEAIHQILELSKLNTQYFGQYAGAAERYVTMVKLVDGTELNVRIPIHGDHDVLDERWADVFRPVSLETLNCISNFKFECTKFKFNYNTFLWDNEHPYQIKGRVDRRALKDHYC